MFHFVCFQFYFFLFAGFTSPQFFIAYPLLLRRRSFRRFWSLCLFILARRFFNVLLIRKMVVSNMLKTLAANPDDPFILDCAITALFVETNSEAFVRATGAMHRVARDIKFLCIATENRTVFKDVPRRCRRGNEAPNIDDSLFA